MTTQYAYAYVRVSTREQATRRCSIPTQRDMINEFARARGIEILDIYEEVGSVTSDGSIYRRPEFQKLLKQARRRELPIIVVDLDRLSRVRRELENLLRSHKIIMIREGVEDDPARLAAHAAQISSKTAQLKQRTRQGTDRAKREGKLLGNRRNLAEARQLAREAVARNAKRRIDKLEEIVDRIQFGRAKTCDEIADALNRRGFRTPRGHPWTRKNVQPFLLRIKQNRLQRAKEAEENAKVPGFGEW